MRELRKVYAIWRRELLRYTREKSRIVSSLAAPLLWLLVFGTGLQFARGPLGVDYQAFLYPGVIGMTLLFTSVFSGVSVIWDREFGFLKEMLVAPVSRSSIVLGKALGGAISALIQATILLPLAPLMGVTVSWQAIPLLFVLMLIIAVGLTCIGLLIASLMQSMEGFNLIMGFAIQPMFFLSGALFPLTGIPDWLRDLSYLNPLTYGIDALRWTMFPEFATVLPIEVEVAILFVFALATVLACSYTFSRKK